MAEMARTQPREITGAVTGTFIKIFPSSSPTFVGTAVQSVTVSGVGLYLVTLKPEYRHLLSRLYGLPATLHLDSLTTPWGVNVGNITTSLGAFQVSTFVSSTGVLTHLTANDNNFVLIELAGQRRAINDGSAVNGSST